MEQQKILVINDDDNVRDIICTFLKSKSFQVLDAANGFSGIEEARKQRPDLILLDVMMPEIDGYAVCERLKKIDETKDIPVIFLSSLNSPKDKIKGLEAGGVDFVTRVEDRGELLARVQTHLRINALSREIQEKNVQLTQKQELLDKDLEMAAEIQRSLLPSLKINIPSIDLAWKCLPYEQIGGDIFNCIPINEDVAAFYILDVSGHGVASAMVTVAISQFMNQLMNNPIVSVMELPKMIVENLNLEFPYDRFNGFFTFFYMILNLKTGEISYCNAGHPPPIVLHPDKMFECLKSSNAAIGVANTPFSMETLQLKKRDKLVLYTDGIIECKDATENLYGQDRFQHFVEGIKEKSPQAIVGNVYVELKNYSKELPQLDDISLMIFEWK